MKTIGKILLFIGGLLFFASSIYSIVTLISTCVKTPEVFFKQEPFYVGIVALAIVILWIIIDLCGGISGMIYSLNGHHRGWVQVLTILILFLFVLNLIGAITTAISEKRFVWGDWSSLVYGGVPGILYVLGYFLDRKHAK